MRVYNVAGEKELYDQAAMGPRATLGSKPGGPRHRQADERASHGAGGGGGGALGGPGGRSLAGRVSQAVREAVRHKPKATLLNEDLRELPYRWGPSILISYFEVCML